MAEAGVSADALKGKIVEQLQAVHVEIEDMSGMKLSTKLAPPITPP